MSSGIFFNVSKDAKKTCNGSFIKYEGELYIVSCSHPFYGIDQTISFLVQPNLQGTNVNFEISLEDLPDPIFHPTDNQGHTHEIAIIPLDKEQKATVLSSEAKIFELEVPFSPPIKNNVLKFQGYNAGELNNSEFQGSIELISGEYEYISEEFFINPTDSNSPRKTLNNHLLSGKKDTSLGFGYSGSLILSSDNKVKGIFFAEITPTSNKFQEETKYGALLFAGSNKIINTIEQKV